MNNKSQWFEQYRKMLRWYERFKSINNGTKHNRPSEYYQDEIEAFFINCFHLRDWIKNDQSLKITDKNKRLRKFIDESNNMKICHDICIGRKHLQLDRPKADKDTRFGSRHHNLSFGGNNAIYSAKYTIISGGKTFDAFALATSCIKEWKDFIKNINSSI